MHYIYTSIICLQIYVYNYLGTSVMGHKQTRQAVYGSRQSTAGVGCKIPSSVYEPLARHVKLRVAYAPGMPGTFSPPTRVSDPAMHHG